MSDPTVAAAFITAFGVIVAASIGAFVNLGRRIDKVHDKAEVVRNEVQNSHRTNLRDDLDALKATVVDGIQNLRDDVKAVQDRQDTAASTVVAVRKEAQTAANVVDRKVSDLSQRLDRHIDHATD